MKETFQGFTFSEYKEYLNKIKAENSKVKDAYSLLDDDDEQIDAVLHDKTLSPREIIEIIALCRRSNYKKTAGGANKAAENETDRLYAKNPWKFVEEFLQNADDCSYEHIPKIDIIIDTAGHIHVSNLLGVSSKEEGKLRRAIEREKTKTADKIKILEEKLKYVGTYSLDAICLLDVI